jgi:hypothetical protein
MLFSEALPMVVWTVDHSGHAYDIVDTPGHGVDWLLRIGGPRCDKGVVLAMVEPELRQSTS